MSFDQLVLFLQNLLDRFVRRVRLGPAPVPAGRRLLIVQIDGLARAVLERAVAGGQAPFLAHLLRRHDHRLQPMSVGLPTSTPTFQLAAMYGVRPDIPGFRYHDRRHGADVYFPRGGDAARVEAAQAGGRLGIMHGGSTYGCVFTGGATNSLFSFARIKRPTGVGLLQAVSALLVLGWVFLKSLTMSLVEIARTLLRLVADPVGESARGWKWLAIKIGISVWLRELFTLSVSRDLYAGVPAVYVNYLDYDVVAHAYGPRHRRALRALRRIDHSILQLWRVLRRVPEHRYDLYVLSDHGVAASVPYTRVSGGRSLEDVLLDELLDARRGEGGGTTRRRHLAAGLRGYRAGRAPGLFQRFLNYLESDFPWVLGEGRAAREPRPVRVLVAGPNAFVYFLDAAEALTIERIDERHPGLAEEISRGRGIGFVLARAGTGPVCVWRGKRYRLGEGEAGPFAGREDLPVVLDGLRALMAMPSAGDLVIYGIGAPEGHVSFLPELGAHAGPSPEELHTFIIHPPEITLPSPISDPVQLYGHFVRYQESTETAA
ncbi:MAG: alkaline phosphatase family protein [Candidatus Rokubacteria bacterium]|nr:alkaline phosphatase family protein [Candidatus Rokubacteria bacterium]